MTSPRPLPALAGRSPSTIPGRFEGVAQRRLRRDADRRDDGTCGWGGRSLSTGSGAFYRIRTGDLVVGSGNQVTRRRRARFHRRRSGCRPERRSSAPRAASCGPAPLRTWGRLPVVRVDADTRTTDTGVIPHRPSPACPMGSAVVRKARERFVLGTAKALPGRQDHDTASRIVGRRSVGPRSAAAARCGRGFGQAPGPSLRVPVRGQRPGRASCDDQPGRDRADRPGGLSRPLGGGRRDRGTAATIYRLDRGRCASSRRSGRRRWTGSPPAPALSGRRSARATPWCCGSGAASGVRAGRPCSRSQAWRSAPSGRWSRSRRSRRPTARGRGSRSSPGRGRRRGLRDRDDVELQVPAQDDAAGVRPWRRAIATIVSSSSTFAKPSGEYAVTVTPSSRAASSIGRSLRYGWNSIWFTAIGTVPSPGLAQPLDGEVRDAAAPDQPGVKSSRIASSVSGERDLRVRPVDQEEVDVVEPELVERALAGRHQVPRGGARSCGTFVVTKSSSRAQPRRARSPPGPRRGCRTRAPCRCAGSRRRAPSRRPGGRRPRAAATCRSHGAGWRSSTRAAARGSKVALPRPRRGRFAALPWIHSGPPTGRARRRGSRGMRRTRATRQQRRWRPACRCSSWRQPQGRRRRLRRRACEARRSPPSCRTSSGRRRRARRATGSGGPTAAARARSCTSGPRRRRSSTTERSSRSSRRFPGHTYGYVVRAVNDPIELSGDSNCVTVTYDEDPPEIVGSRPQPQPAGSVALSYGASDPNGPVQLSHPAERAGPAAAVQPDRRRRGLRRAARVDVVRRRRRRVRRPLRVPAVRVRRRGQRVVAAALERARAGHRPRPRRRPGSPRCRATGRSPSPSAPFRRSARTPTSPATASSTSPAARLPRTPATAPRCATSASAPRPAC